MKILLETNMRIFQINMQNHRRVSVKMHHQVIQMNPNEFLTPSSHIVMSDSVNFIIKYNQFQLTILLVKR